MKKIFYVALLIVVVFMTSASKVLAADVDFMKTGSYVSCGGEKTLLKNIPKIFPEITSGVYNLVMVGVPVVLVIMGMVDLAKGVMGQKEDEIKKSRDTFMKRIIMGVIIFLVVLVVKLFIGVFNSSSNSSRIVSCIDCFISNSCV